MTAPPSPYGAPAPAFMPFGAAMAVNASESSGCLVEGGACEESGEDVSTLSPASPDSDGDSARVLEEWLECGEDACKEGAEDGG